MQSLWPQTVLVANNNCCLITYLLLRCHFNNNAFSRMMQFSGPSVRNPTNDSRLPLKCICRQPWCRRKDPRDLLGGRPWWTLQPTSDFEEEKTKAAGRGPDAEAACMPFSACRAQDKFFHEAVQPPLLQDLVFFVLFFFSLNKSVNSLELLPSLVTLYTWVQI